MSKRVGEGAGRAGARRSVKILVVLGSVFFSLLVAELILRAVGYSFPVFYTTDPQRGYALKPGMEGWYGKEGGSHVRINSAGLRDREHAREKPPGAFRVAVVGDSYAEALQVDQEAAFPSVLERTLRQCGAFDGREVEVINFGVSGYGTAQELITLREHVWPYAPDLVLLAVTTNNDITDNSRALKRTDEIPYFVRRDGRLVLDDSFRQTRAFRLRDSSLNRAAKWVRDHSRVIQLGHQAHGAIKTFLASRRSRLAAPARDDATATAATSQDVQTANAATPVGVNAATPADARTAAPADVGIDNLIYREPSDAVWAEAWGVTEELIVLMRGEVEARGARFLVVTMTNGVQVHPDRAAREAFARRVGATDLFYPERRISALGEREGFRVLNLAPALQAYAEENRTHLHGFGASLGSGHWNEHGHRIGGELIAREVCAWLSQ